MRRLAGAAAALAFVTLAPPAAAQVPYRGVTGQGGLVELRTNETGATGAITIRWRARCTNGRTFHRQVTSFELLGEETPPTRRMAVRDRFKAPDRGGRIGTIFVRLNGRFVRSSRGPGLNRWEGTLRARIVVRRHGRLAERCAMRTRWRAMPQGIGSGRFTATSEPQEPGQGQPATFSFDAATATMSALGTREAVGFDIETDDERVFSGSFRAPALNRLQAGQRYETAGAPMGGASMSVSGSGLCSASGDFTITAIRFDRLRRLVHFAATFDGSCFSPYEIVRGSLEWRAAS